MIQHNLDPAVAEKPDELIVYGGTGRAARNWQCFDKILETLQRDKKSVDGTVRFVLPEDLGRLVVRPVTSVELLREAIRSLAPTTG